MLAGERLAPALFFDARKAAMYSTPAATRSSGVRSLVRELRREDEADEDVEMQGEEETKVSVKTVFSSMV